MRPPTRGRAARGHRGRAPVDPAGDAPGRVCPPRVGAAACRDRVRVRKSGAPEPRASTPVLRPPPSSAPRARSRRRACAWPASSSARRLLPIPASPVRSTSRPLPDRPSSNAAMTSASSRSRPTKTPEARLPLCASPLERLGAFRARCVETTVMVQDRRARAPAAPCLARGREPRASGAARSGRPRALPPAGHTDTARASAGRRRRSRSGCSATSRSSSPATSAWRPRSRSASSRSSRHSRRSSSSRAISSCAKPSYATSASGGPRQSRRAAARSRAALSWSPGRPCCGGRRRGDVAARSASSSSVPISST